MTKKQTAPIVRLVKKSAGKAKPKTSSPTSSEPKIVCTAKDADVILDTQFVRLKRYLLRTFGPGKAVYRGLLIANTFADDGIDPVMLRKRGKQHVH